MGGAHACVGRSSKMVIWQSILGHPSASSSVVRFSAAAEPLLYAGGRKLLNAPSVYWALASVPMLGTTVGGRGGAGRNVGLTVPVVHTLAGWPGCGLRYLHSGSVVLTALRGQGPGEMRVQKRQRSRRASEGIGW